MAADATARTRAWGVGLVLASAVCFGASGPFGKALIEAGLGPLQAVWLRIATAALVLVPVVVIMRGRSAARGLRMPPPALRSAPRRLVRRGSGGARADDTIFALSSGRGVCGVAVVRVSGAGSDAVLGRLTGGAPASAAALAAASASFCWRARSESSARCFSNCSHIPCITCEAG